MNRLKHATQSNAWTAMITRRHILAAGGGLATLGPVGPSAAGASTWATNARTVAAPQRTTTMEIQRIGSFPSGKAPGDFFTGAVRIDSRFQGRAPARVGGAFVTFEPGARTAWHTHPLGQLLIVTAGCGWVQSDGGPKEDIRPGDIVWIPAGEKHWHGATTSTAMTHIAISEQLDGKSVEWMEKVGDEQYRA
jgi:quercetin dioxygenase-like cupin family protein